MTATKELPAINKWPWIRKKTITFTEAMTMAANIFVAFCGHQISKELVSLRPVDERTARGVAE
jgi:hypothetical protein